MTRAGSMMKPRERSFSLLAFYRSARPSEPDRIGLFYGVHQLCLYRISYPDKEDPVSVQYQLTTNTTNTTTTTAPVCGDWALLRSMIHIYTNHTQSDITIWLCECTHMRWMHGWDNCSSRILPGHADLPSMQGPSQKGFSAQGE